MPFNLLLETGDNLLLENGDLLLLESSLPSSNTVLIESSETFPSKINENTTPLIKAILVDDLDQQIDPDILLAVLLQVHDSGGTIMRDYEDILLSGSDVTITAGVVETELEWNAQTQDAELVDRVTNAKETRFADLHFLFGTASKSGSLTDPFATVDTDNTVTVTIVAHGLATTQDHNVFFSPGTAVGGLLIGGAFNVKAEDIVDVDTFKIEAPCPATSTASGGGTVPYWLNARNNTGTIKYAVNRIGPTC